MADLWFSLGTSVSNTNKTDCHDITEILLKVALNTINQAKPYLLLSVSQDPIFKNMLLTANFIYAHSLPF